MTGILERWDFAHARYLERDDELRAVITWDDASRERAVELERSESRGPLHGVLVGVKDNIDTARLRTTAGSAILDQNVPDSDATVVRRLRAAGAVVVAKLNLAEFAWGGTTQNRVYGSCRNPWDTDRIPGGSSGGSGAALIAGYCDLALGTDTGASVRLPASVNGVLGLRPTFGSVSNHGVFPTALTQDTVGAMGRTAAETARLAAVIAGYDPADPNSTNEVFEPADARLGQDTDGLRVGVPESFFFDDLDPGVAARVEEFLTWLPRAGTVVVPVADFQQAEAFRHWSTIVPAEGAAHHEDRLRARADDYSEDVRGRLRAGLEITGPELARSLAWRRAYRRRLALVLDDLDLIVSPTVAADVPPIIGTDSRAQTAALGAITYPWALHDGPTLNLPIGLHPVSGLPVGMALTAARGRESTLFQVADRYQRDTDWHTLTPHRYP
ncbi:amidase [Pseudolysinimonas sp.]|uniref:amidase n=1 Tax=Pseudolysinimonas sp. TaxID=2680009 RepID=UPI0037849B24